jgi:hypothetical protein
MMVAHKGSNLGPLQCAAWLGVDYVVFFFERTFSSPSSVAFSSLSSSVISKDQAAKMSEEANRSCSTDPAPLQLHARRASDIEVRASFFFSAGPTDSRCASSASADGASSAGPRNGSFAQQNDNMKSWPHRWPTT